MISDPGIGKEDAPVGTTEWAQRWRLQLQSSVKNAVFDTKRISDIVAVGNKHRAWTLLNRKDGTLYRDWATFVSDPMPWGLGKNPKLFMELLQQSQGKRAAQLETVPEPAEPGRGKEKEDHDDPLFGRAAERRLRAINRAPEIVAELYREGVINQIDAARLGQEGIDRGEVAAEMARIAEEVKQLPVKEKRKLVNAKAKELAGCQKPSPEELVVKTFRKCNSRLDAIKAMLSELLPHEAKVVRDWLKEMK